MTMEARRKFILTLKDGIVGGFNFSGAAWINSQTRSG